MITYKLDHDHDHLSVYDNDREMLTNVDKFMTNLSKYGSRSYEESLSF